MKTEGKTKKTALERFGQDGQEPGEREKEIRMMLGRGKEEGKGTEKKTIRGERGMVKS